ncbi:aspartyl protease family protein [Klebsiella variicola]|uniref:aspartyl protease family protein n=1 Tax=Klebsiella variicola TaxID=244366 RepID=UPI00164A73A8|nr:retroviral-like aspartic protease family protein [Klebsiella variicola]MBC5038241.1 retroviral-like aspartic protease family protein [Klebsiella variicola]
MLGLHKIQFMDLNGNISDTPLTPIIPVVKINISKPANMPVEQYALIDTGATHSVIDTTLADLLNLKIIDSTNIRGVTGTIPTTIREAAIHIGSSATLFTQLTASPLIQKSNESTYTIILGMDILSTGVVQLNFKENIFSIDLRSK